MLDTFLFSRNFKENQKELKILTQTRLGTFFGMPKITGFKLHGCKILYVYQT